MLINFWLEISVVFFYVNLVNFLRYCERNYPSLHTRHDFRTFLNSRTTIFASHGYRHRSSRLFWLRSFLFYEHAFLVWDTFSVSFFPPLYSHLFYFPAYISSRGGGERGKLKIAVGDLSHTSCPELSESLPSSFDPLSILEGIFRITTISRLDLRISRRAVTVDLARYLARCNDYSSVR